MDNAIHWINHYPVDSVQCSWLRLIRGIVIYPANSVIHPLNKQTLENHSWLWLLLTILLVALSSWSLPVTILRKRSTRTKRAVIISLKIETIGDCYWQCNTVMYILLLDGMLVHYRLPPPPLNMLSFCSVTQQRPVAMEHFGLNLTGLSCRG